MKNFIGKTIVTGLSVLVAAFFLSGVTVHNPITALWVAIVLGLLNNFIKPLLVILTIPITLFTFGLFLLFINVLIVKWTSQIVPGFWVRDWWSALLFSFIVSMVTSILNAFKA